MVTIESTIEFYGEYHKGSMSMECTIVWLIDMWVGYSHTTTPSERQRLGYHAPGHLTSFMDTQLVTRSESRRENNYRAYDIASFIGH